MLHAADMFLKNSGIEAMHLLNINKLFMQAFEALFNLEYTPISWKSEIYCCSCVAVTWDHRSITWKCSISVEFY